jgi:hypothetical protein
MIAAATIRRRRRVLCDVLDEDWVCLEMMTPVIDAAQRKLVGNGTFRKFDQLLSPRRVVEAARGNRRGGRNLTRRDIFIWISVVLFFNQISGVITEMSSTSFSKLMVDIFSVGIFQYMAWYAVFRLLVSSDAMPVARGQDFLIAVALCFLVFLPTVRIIWVAATGIAIYWWIFNAGDPKLRAAGAVLAALSVQELWGHAFFNLVAFHLLSAETAVVGTILKVIRAGTVWQANVITGPTGYGIVIFDECSAFHNLSLAMLCWITVSKLRYQTWQIRDFVVGVAIGITMILWNVSRLCFMAWDVESYYYWHDGTGVEIFAIGASLSILLISLYCSGPGRRMT